MQNLFYLHLDLNCHPHSSISSFQTILFFLCALYIYITHYTIYNKGENKVEGGVRAGAFITSLAVVWPLH